MGQMERSLQNSGLLEEINNAKPPSVVEIFGGMKQTAIILRSDIKGQMIEFLYRPEKGVILSLDPRIPSPQELYRDIAYHKMDEILGWNLSAPVIEWRLGTEHKGVLRPYWRNIGKMEWYDFRRENLVNNDFWIKVAVLDYICGTVGRSSNDVLIVKGRPVLVDSGLSFVDGLNFVCQGSLIRERLSGAELPTKVLSDLKSLKGKSEEIKKQISQFVNSSQIEWVLKRAESVSNNGVVI